MDHSLTQHIHIMVYQYVSLGGHTDKSDEADAYEKDFAIMKQETTGLSASAALHGYKSSSTRAELMGAIIALLSPYP
eukprot:3251047-Karenia_brevis.AAC.1